MQIKGSKYTIFGTHHRTSKLNHVDGLDTYKGGPPVLNNEVPCKRYVRVPKHPEPTLIKSEIGTSTGSNQRRVEKADSKQGHDDVEHGGLSGGGRFKQWKRLAKGQEAGKGEFSSNCSLPEKRNSEVVAREAVPFSQATTEMRYENGTLAVANLLAEVEDQPLQQQ